MTAPETPAAAPAKKKRKKPTNLRLKTRAWLRAAGWALDTVERKSRFISYDFLGFADLNGIRLGFAPLAVQVTSENQRAEHRDKMTVGDGAPGVREWCAQDGMALLLCWGLRRDPVAPGKKGTGALKWRITSCERVAPAECHAGAPIPALLVTPFDHLTLVREAAR